MFQSYITREINKASRRTPAPSSNEPALQRVSLHTLRSTSIPAVIQCLALMNSYNNTHDIVPYSAFYNDAVNEHIDIKEDFPRFRMPEGVSFCSYPFLLSPTTKSEIIKIESVILMRTELQDSFFRAMFSGVTCPYLVLEVRRDNLVRDTLYQLDLKLSQDLRKQLKVRFVGEEGVDEGGVQKEFFQLIVRDVFSPKYGIFRANEESQYYWFAPRAEPSKDALEEMRLTGQLIGLAVYNAVILDIHLPPAMYKKLLGVPVSRDDLREFDPTLYHGLVQILNLSAAELECLERTFEVEYDDLGEIRTHELIPGGASTPLTVDNREEFIDKYADFIFNVSCKDQFTEFKAGFDRICGGSFVRYMRPQELELLVCGSSDLDFGALEGSTIYDGGYTRETRVIQFFWTVVNEFTDDLKRKLLFFATSSDRVPIGGLSKLHFVIAKNGGDSDRLPTSHTCFNVLLLPEYSDIDKLRERLLTAIHNSEGFGMI
ncbi:HECT-domain-containing protein [Martensiomyces pterosporus]|nr:HECT-domain-containing protein [Martensiomyces pterosporus]